MTSENVFDWHLHSNFSYLQQNLINEIGHSFVSMNPTSNISQMSFGHNQNDQIPCSNYASMIANINRGNVNINGNMSNKGTYVSNTNHYVTSVGNNNLGDTSVVISTPNRVSNGFQIHLDSASNVGRQRTVQFTDHVTYDKINRATRTARTDTVRTNGIRRSVLDEPQCSTHRLASIKARHLLLD